MFLWKLELYRLILCAGALTIPLDATGEEAMRTLDDPSGHGDVLKFHVKRSFSLNFVNYP